MQTINEYTQQVLDLIHQVVGTQAWLTVPVGAALLIGVVAMSLIASRMREIWR